MEAIPTTDHSLIVDFKSLCVPAGHPWFPFARSQRRKQKQGYRHINNGGAQVFLFLFSGIVIAKWVPIASDRRRPMVNITPLGTEL